MLGSLTDIPLRDDSVDLMVCYHVLEHIPDDRAAMREMARVLSPGGLALVQVPFRPGTVTDEDPDAPEEERVRRFGQADHVRYYGDDFEDRLVEAGLAFQRVTPRSLLGDDMCDWLRLGPHQMVWIVRSSSKAAVPAPLDETPTSLTRTLDAMLGEMVEFRRRAGHAPPCCAATGQGRHAAPGRERRAPRPWAALHSAEDRPAGSTPPLARRPPM